MKNKKKILHLESGRATTWLIPILFIQSIIIIGLLVYIVNEDKSQKVDERETPTIAAPIVSVQKEPVEEAVSAPHNEVQPKAKPESLPVAKTSVAPVKEEPIVKEATSLPTEKPKEYPMPGGVKGVPGERKPREPFVNDPNKKAVDVVVAAPVAEKEVVSNPISNTNIVKKPKVEEQPKQIAVGVPKLNTDKKPEVQPAKVNNEPKAPAVQAEAAPVDFVIPEIKDDTGAFTLRSNLGRNDAISQGNATVKTETAVDMAIAWLAIHQESDGHWDSGKYEGTASAEFDLAVTGASVLSFLSAGQTDTKGEWSQTVQLALNWLIKNQKKNGSWDNRNYTNGICTMAVTEAAAMGCGGEAIKKSAVLAVDYILSQQHDTGCFDYTGKTSREDMSVTGWCITGLKSGALAGIKRKEIGEAYEKLRVFLEVAEGTNDVSETSKGLAWYTPGTIGSGVAGGACQSIAMFVSQQIGRENVDPSPWMIAAADGQIAKLPTKYVGSNVYRIYYTYLTMRQLGGKHWLAWNEPVSNMIISAQRQDGDFRGSWDKNGSSIEKAGRVMYTAFLCLCLEIYYRYPTVF